MLHNEMLLTPLKRSQAPQMQPLNSSLLPPGHIPNCYQQLFGNQPRDLESVAPFEDPVERLTTSQRRFYHYKKEDSFLLRHMPSFHKLSYEEIVDQSRDQEPPTPNTVPNNKATYDYYA